MLLHSFFQNRFTVLSPEAAPATSSNQGSAAKLQYTVAVFLAAANLAGRSSKDSPLTIITACFFVEAGDWKKTEVRFKSALTREGTVAEKAKAKAQRAIATTQRISRLAGEATALQGDLDDAPNPQAAVATVHQFGVSTNAAALVAAYGCEDARQVATARGETEFLYRFSDPEAHADLDAELARME